MRAPRRARLELKESGPHYAAVLDDAGKHVGWEPWPAAIVAQYALASAAAGFLELAGQERPVVHRRMTPDEIRGLLQRAADLLK